METNLILLTGTIQPAGGGKCCTYKSNYKISTICKLYRLFSK